MRTYRLTCDIWGYVPGIGLACTVMEDLTAEYFQAENDASALEYAEAQVGKGYRWCAWYAEGAGYERNRTAIRFNASWMRIDRVEM